MGSLGIDREEFELAFAPYGIDAEDTENVYFYLPNGEVLSITLLAAHNGPENTLWKGSG